MSSQSAPLTPQELVPPVLERGDELVARAGVGPYKLAFRRLRRNRGALIAGAFFLAVFACCLAAPLYASFVAHTGPTDEHISEKVRIGGHVRDVVSPIGIPVGPTWGSHFLLGADFNGRDVAVRLLYGGRNSLVIGVAATAITMIAAVMIALFAGYFRGWVDSVLARMLDVIWAYPAILLGVAIGMSLELGGIAIGPLRLSGTSLFIPAVIIGFVNIPYVAKPIRGQVIALREQEFVDAARILDAGALRIMFKELLPNLTSTIIVFFPLMIANSILLEAGLSFLGAGVQPPNPSWGTMISDGVQLITASPHLVLVPGLTLVMTVLSINIFGEGVRDALDPRTSLGGHG